MEANYYTFLFWLFFMLKIVSGQNHEHYCIEERCGKNGPPIRFPFRLNTSLQPEDCGYPGFNLFCSGHQTAMELLPSKITKIVYFVKKIDYKVQEIELFGYDVFPLKLLNNRSKNILEDLFPFEPRFQRKNSSYSLFDCAGREDLVLVPSNDVLDSENYFFCSKVYGNISYPDEMYSYVGKLNLRWSKPDCRACERCKLKKVKDVGTDNDIETECYVPEPRKGKTKISSVICSTTFKIIALTLSCLIVALATIYIHFLYHKNKEKQIRIEKFLEDYMALKPSRYTYADIKKITNNLKNKLGQGAFGTVFKGKLSNEVCVAVKILNSSKGNGEEFINEVATMGQIHHVNVVRLVGFCAEGFRRALVYEFLPNDSLEKYISPLEEGKNRRLSWETLQDIALGIAKGIEYLHQGCDQRILHFDIKPHNVLLGHNYVPKISDFGLAKLCSKDQSLVSMTAARGTVGYIAPEVLTRNFGNVSYKSDVYSFGVLLLEMVGGRKNSNPINNDTTNHEIYYPEWIYNLLEQGKDLRIGIEGEGDCRIIAKKLAIVGLWCIQWHPMARPTMKAVVQMLEGRGDQLTMPPNPFASTNSPRTTNKKTPARLVALELDVISE